MACSLGRPPVPPKVAHAAQKLLTRSEAAAHLARRSVSSSSCRRGAGCYCFVHWGRHRSAFGQNCRRGLRTSSRLAVPVPVPVPVPAPAQPQDQRLGPGAGLFRSLKAKSTAAAKADGIRLVADAVDDACDKLFAHKLHARDDLTHSGSGSGSASGSGRVLGLDVSMRNVGFAVLDQSGALVESGVLSSKAGTPVIECGMALGGLMGRLRETYPAISLVAVEEFMKQFASGRFHTRGLFSLARLNGIAVYEAARHFDVTPAEYMPNEIRSFFGISASEAAASVDAVAPESRPRSAPSTLIASKRKLVKEAVVSFVSRLYPDVVWETTCAGNLKPNSYDRADAILVALYALAYDTKMELAMDEDLFLRYVWASSNASDCLADHADVGSSSEGLRLLGATIGNLAALGADGVTPAAGLAVDDEAAMKTVTRLRARFLTTLRHHLAERFAAQRFRSFSE